MPGIYLSMNGLYERCFFKRRTIEEAGGGRDLAVRRWPSHSLLRQRAKVNRVPLCHRGPGPLTFRGGLFFFFYTICLFLFSSLSPSSFSLYYFFLFSLHTTSPSPPNLPLYFFPVSHHLLFLPPSPSFFPSLLPSMRLSSSPLSLHTAGAAAASAFNRAGEFFISVGASCRC